MNITQQIDMLIYSENKQAYNTLKELLTLSEKSDILYSYFNRFVEMMNNQDNSYIRTRGLRLIAYNSKWDINNQVNDIIHQWLKHIEDEKPITARQCIKDAIIIARNKPELIDVILEALEEFHTIYDESMQNLVYKDRQKAIHHIRQYTW